MSFCSVVGEVRFLISIQLQAGAWRMSGGTGRARQDWDGTDTLPCGNWDASQGQGGVCCYVISLELWRLGEGRIPFFSHLYFLLLLFFLRSTYNTEGAADKYHCPAHQMEPCWGGETVQVGQAVTP